MSEEKEINKIQIKARKEINKFVHWRITDLELRRLIVIGWNAHKDFVKDKE